MEDNRLSAFWNDIPIDKPNAVTYEQLCEKWGMTERGVRCMLHDLSRYDNGDKYILIRSSNGRGFYRTTDENAIRSYRQECLNRGRNVFAPVRKINRVLAIDENQISLYEDE